MILLHVLYVQCYNAYFLLLSLFLSLSLVSANLSQRLLMVLLPIGRELVKALSNFELKQYSIFKDYFQSCVLLAGNKTHRGHLELAKAASDWLPLW